MKIIHMIALLACVACASALPQDEERAPSRGLLKRGLLAKGKGTTTTTTTPAPQEEAEYEEDEYVVEGEGQEASTEAPVSSTEGKKLVGSGVRPFRSNTDLLETLKRRRAQAAEAKLHGYVSTAAPAPEGPTEAPVKANFSKKRFNSQGGEDSPAQSKTRNRFSRPSPKSLPEPEEPEQNDAAPPPAAAPARTGRTFRVRGGN